MANKYKNEDVDCTDKRRLILLRMGSSEKIKYRADYQVYTESIISES